MHLKIGYCFLFTPIYQLTEKRNRFHVQNCPCGTVGANIGYYENIKYGESKHNRTRSSVFMHTNTSRVTIQGNITA